MPKSATHTFFAIPELIVLLSLHVHRSDLTRCVLVCKDWSRHFEPVLWRDLVIDDRVFSLMKTIPPSRIAKNLPHIRKVTFDRADEKQLGLLAGGLPVLGSFAMNTVAVCTNLKYIDICDFVVNRLIRIPKILITLLDYNPRLTHLHASFEILEFKAVTTAVSKLWHLQQLHFKCFFQDTATLRNPLLVLRSCLALPQLTDLSFHRDLAICWDQGDETMIVSKLESVISEATISRFSHPNAKPIKSLVLPCNLTGIRNPLPLLLMKSKLLDLETCEVPWFRSDATTQEIQDVVRKHCPNLRHIQFAEFFDEGQDGQASRAFIRGCSGLQSFTAHHFMDSTDRGPRMLLSELVTHHHTTLEDFELTEPVHVFSRDLQKVLSQCKQLKRFWVASEEDGDDRMSGIAFRDICSADWVCTELRELSITLNRCRSERDPFGELGEEEEQSDPQVWLTASTTKRVFQQIGRLKKLEVLEIDIDRSYRTKAKEEDYAWDLTLWKGWLGELADLKNLRSLRLRADFWSYMIQEDVEFMHEHWPLLNEIIITRKIPEFHIKRHWQWLLEKRPYLRIKGMSRLRDHE